jgi:predicted DNA-binding protein (UPF0251 family)
MCYILLKREKKDSRCLDVGPARLICSFEQNKERPMPRPRLPRWVTGVPKATYFKPQGAPLHGLEEVRLAVEGLEALRLADLDGLTTEAAAAGMGVSRHTFGRVLAEARACVARALVTGAALRIGGGHYELAEGGLGAQTGGSPPQEDTTMQQGNGSQGQQGGGRGPCGRGLGRGQGQQGRGQGQGRGGQAGRGMGGGGSRNATATGSVLAAAGSDLPETERESLLRQTRELESALDAVKTRLSRLENGIDQG